MKRDLSRAANRVAQAWAAVAIAVYFISGLAYLYFGSVSVIYADLWRIYQRCLTTPWARFVLSRWNDHPCIFPGLLWIVDLQCFHGKQAPITLFGLGLTILTTLILLVPMWRDKAVSLTARMLGAVIIIVANFWMGRDDVTAIGFNDCMGYLVVAAVGLAYLWLPRLHFDSPHFWAAVIVVLLSGLVASLSYGTGVAVWPTLLLLAWAARLDIRSLVVLLIFTIMAVILIRILPLPPDDTFYSVHQLAAAVAVAPFSLLGWFCTAIGAPVAYSIAGWAGQQPCQMCESPISLWIGMTGLILALIAVVSSVVKRDIGHTGLKFTGLALITFGVFATLIIVIGRAPGFRTVPSEAAAPRYFFWTTFFWSGLLLLLLECGARTRYLRWPAWCAVLATPIFAWPSHFSSAMGDRFLRVNCEIAATSLINGVRDLKQQNFLAEPELIDPLLPLLRAKRLDMFADGLQDWIGLNETSLFSGKHKPEKFNGQCSIDALLQCNNGAPAVRIAGTAIKERHVNSIVRSALAPVSWIFGPQIKKGYVTPTVLVIVDPEGVIRGVARSYPLSPIVNRVFYHSKLTTTDFVGYIRDYSPELKYVVRSADGVLSDEKIPVEMK